MGLKDMALSLVGLGDNPQTPLHGSSVQPAVFDLADGTQLSLGDVVRKAYTDNGAASPEEWNGLPDDFREDLIAGVVKTLSLKDSGPATETKPKEGDADKAAFVVAASPAPEPVAMDAKTAARRDVVMEALSHLSGQDLQVQWSDNGSVTFKRGLHAESIHSSSDLKTIIRCAQRISGSRTFVLSNGEGKYVGSAAGEGYVYVQQLKNAYKFSAQPDAEKFLASVAGKFGSCSVADVAQLLAK